MKKLTLGLIVGLLIGTASTAIAATSDTVQAVFAKFSLTVNGEVKQLNNDPVVIDGVSYLPVREVAGLLGYDVGFEDGTIVLDNDPKQEPEPTESDTEAAPPSQDEEGDVNNMEQTSEWITLEELLEQENITYKPFNDNTLTISIGEVFIHVPINVDRELSVMNQHGSFTVKPIDGQIMINKSDLIRIGIIN